MKGKAPNTSRVTSQTEVVMNLTTPVCATAGQPMRTNSATITAATTNTARPSTPSTAAQARSGRFDRAEALSGARSGSRTVVTISLAVCKRGLPLDGDGLQRRFHLLHQRRRQRSVVQRRGHLLPLVDGPPEKLDQRLSLPRVGQLLVDEQIGEGGDGIGVLAGSVRDGHAVVRRNLCLGCGGGHRVQGRLDPLAVAVPQLDHGELVLVGVRELDVADGPFSLFHGGGDS